MNALLGGGSRAFSPTIFLVIALLMPPFSAAANAGLLDLLLVDRNTGAAIANARVDLNQGGQRTRLATGADGHVSLVTPEQAGQYFSATIHAEGYVDRLLQWRPEDKDSIPATYTVKLEPATKISGIVTDDAGEPVSGARVVVNFRPTEAESQSHDRTYVSFKTVRSGAGGAWTFNGAPSEFAAAYIGVWDYRYVVTDFYDMKEISGDKLRDGSAVLTLERGLPIDGVVVDDKGAPVSGASVAVGGQMASNRVPAQKVHADGKFTYVAKPGQQVVLTATRKGYGTELKEIVMGDQPQQVTIQLSSPKTLRGRVVDTDGNPVPDAWIFPDTWRGNRSLTARIHADAEGRFEWREAPADTVLCDIDATASGFVREQQVPLTASDEEVIVKVRRALKVSGAVVDADTGKPIEQFAVIPGIQWRKEQQPIHWERERSEIKPRDGKFEFAETSARPGYAVRIEAPGYLPAESRVFTLDEKSVALEFKLAKGTGIAATVHTPDGKPVVAARVLLVLAGQTATIMDRDDVNRSALQAKTDNQGKFEFPPQAGVYKIAVFNEAGYTEIDQDAIAKSSDITLTPWGRIDGKLMIGASAGVDKDVVVLPQDQTYDAEQPRIHHQLQKKTDAQGRFTFLRVPSGEWSVARMVMQPTGGGMYMSSPTQMQPVTVEPGQTAQVTVGGKGRAIVGRVIIPPELASQQDWSYAFSCRIDTRTDNLQPPKLPDELKSAAPEQRQKLYEEFAASDAGKAYKAAMEEARKNHRSYLLELTRDGAFRVDDVAAGRYRLAVDIVRSTGDRPAGMGAAVASASLEFVVDEMPTGRSDEPLELPDLPMQMTK